MKVSYLKKRMCYKIALAWLSEYYPVKFEGMKFSIYKFYRGLEWIEFHSCDFNLHICLSSSFKYGSYHIHLTVKKYSEEQEDYVPILDEVKYGVAAQDLMAASV